MKTQSLFVVGACCGAIGAWFVLEDGSNQSIEADSARSVSAMRGNSAPGGDIDERDSGVDDVLDVAPRQVLLESLELRAEVAPRAAFNDALALEDDRLRISALLRVARSWARHAPEEALAQAAALPGEMRSVFESAVAEEWAFVDPAAFFAYAEAAASIDQLTDGLRVLLATDPDRVREIAARYFSRGKQSIDDLYLSAVRAMTSRNPAATIARLQPIAIGQRRDPILTSIAEAYAALDPDAALAWVMSLEPASPEATSTVIKLIATEDVLRAYELVTQAGAASLTIASVRWLLAESALSGRQNPASIATALMQRADRDSAGQQLSALLNIWVRRDSDGAMVWLSANQANLTDETVMTMVSNIAFEDVRLAASLSDRVPREFQNQWLVHVAARYGQFDVEEGMSWISQYEDRSDYNFILTQLLAGATWSDARFVASFIETSGGTFGDGLITTTASRLAEQDPRAAAQWAEQLGDPEQSASAMEGIASAWLQSDPAAVQQWALEQPRGASRDRILDTLLTATLFSPTGLDYESLADGYSSEGAAQQTIAEYVERAVSFPISSPYREAAIVQAEQMLGLLTDPELRREAEDRMAAVR